MISLIKVRLVKLSCAAYLHQLLQLSLVLTLLQLVDVGLHSAALDQVIVVGGLHAGVQGLDLLGLGRYLLLVLALQGRVSRLLVAQLLANLLYLVSVCHG